MFGRKKLIWTAHANAKMRFYGLSEYRVKRVINHPQRIEKGIAENTAAMMQSSGSKKHPYEIWTMIKDESRSGEKIRKVISAWKYPGITRPGEPLPQEILIEIKEAGF